MSLRSVIVTASVALALALAPDATAATWPPPTHDWPAPATATVATSLDVAYRYWAVRGIVPWPRPTLVIRLAHLESPPMLATALIGGNTIWFDDLYFLRATRSRHDVWMRRFAQRDLCTVTVHEVGHTAGLYDGDARFPLMVAVPNQALGECRAAFRLPRRAALRSSPARPVPR